MLVALEPENLFYMTGFWGEAIGILDKDGKTFFETVYNTQKKRIFNALKNSSSDSVIKFKDVLKKIIDGK